MENIHNNKENEQATIITNSAEITHNQKPTQNEKTQTKQDIWITKQNKNISLAHKYIHTTIPRTNN